MNKKYSTVKKIVGKGILTAVWSAAVFVMGCTNNSAVDGDEKHAAIDARPCDIYAEGGTPCVAAHSTTRALYSGYDGPLYEVLRIRSNTRALLDQLPYTPENKNVEDTDTKDDPYPAEDKLNIYPKTAGGIADVAPQEAFCKKGSSSDGPSKVEECYILRIFDQSNNGNDMERWFGSTPATGHKNRRWNALSVADKAPVTLNGHNAYGIFIPMRDGGYRQTGRRTHYYDPVGTEAPKGMPLGNEPQGIYAIYDATHYAAPCCFGYGNAQRTGKNDGPGTMEVLTYGTVASEPGENDIRDVIQFVDQDRIVWTWGNFPGSNTPGDVGTLVPWLMADFEWGIFTGAAAGYNDVDPIPSDWEFLTGMLKGGGITRDGKDVMDNYWELNGGNSQAGDLKNYWSGPRVDRSHEEAFKKRNTNSNPNDDIYYHPSRKQGAIILGTGGDNSVFSKGTFYEGAIVAGYPSEDTEQKIQENIVNAGYKKVNPGAPARVHRWDMDWRATEVRIPPKE